MKLHTTNPFRSQLAALFASGTIALIFSSTAQAVDLSFGSITAPFTITATDQARAMGYSAVSLTTFNNNTGDMSIYWRGAASDVVYMHFNLSSLTGGSVLGDVSLNHTVNAQYGGQITAGQLSTASAAWTYSNGGATPGFTAVVGSVGPANGGYTTGQTASWTLPNATFQGFVNTPASFNGLVISGGAGSEAHFSGLPTLTGTATTALIQVIGATDWTTAVFSNPTLTVSGSNDVSGGNVIVRATGVLSVLGAATLDAGNFLGTITNAGTISFGSSFNQTLSGAISGNGALAKSGTGLLTLAANNSYSGPTSIDGSTLLIDTGGSLNGSGTYLGAITFANNATLQYNGTANQTFTGAITGAGGITKSTSNSDLTLTNTGNTYTGNSTVSAGRFIATAAAHLSNGATSIVQSGTGQLAWNNTAALSNPTNISTIGYPEGDSQNNISGAIRLFGGGISSQITLSGNSRIGAFGSTTNTISGQITGGFGIDFFGYQNFANATTVFVTSNVANDYTGDTTIYNSSIFSTNNANVSTILRLGASNVIPDGASAGNVVFAINGTNNNATVSFDLNGFNETINGLTVNNGTFATRITNAAAGASVLSIGANDTNSSFSGTITDAGVGNTLAITKIGIGTLTLSGANNYIGATSVTAGTLALVGGSQASAITVDSGASLAFTVGSSVTSSSSVNLTSGSVKITGTPTLPSYLLMTASSITGTPALFAAIPGYELVKTNSDTELRLNQTGSTYAGWQTANSTAQAIHLDHDNDGVSNGVEFFLSGPVDSTGFNALPGVTDASGTLSVTWTKAAGYTGTYGTDFVVETSSSLVGAWTPQDVSPTVGYTVTFPSANEVKYTFPAGTKSFARLKVTGP